MTFVCYPRCTTCKKARAWLDGRGVEYEVRDIKENNPTFDELRQWYRAGELPIRKWFNTSGLAYKALGLKDKLATMSDDECLKLLATDGMLVKRPILIAGETVLVGFKQTEWENAFAD